jgi:alkylation response protein AidB-like acyl-CoA dehydrogenase
VDFELAEEQQRYRDEVVAFAQRELNDDSHERDCKRVFSRELWAKCARFGILGLPVPPNYGGSGADALTIVLAMEALGYGASDSGLLFALNAQLWSCQIPILLFGSDEQKRRYLPGLCDGRLIGAQAMTEAGSGSDVFSMSTTARRCGDRFVLNGSKAFITNAPVADLFLVFGVTDSRLGFAGASAFLVERSTPGVVIGPASDKLGLRTAPMSEVAFRDCAVALDSQLGPFGSGMAIFSRSMEWERSCILASVVGTMQRQLEQCLDHARTQERSGQPIGRFQAVSHRLVDMKLRLETARLLLYRLGWQRSKGSSDMTQAALTKLHLSESFVQSSLDALQIYGASGYLTGSQAERDVRDAVASRIYSGTSEIQRNLIAAGLGL